MALKALRYPPSRGTVPMRPSVASLLRQPRSLVRGMRGGNKTLKALGVKQAPFMVLIGAAMPSVLAEISFVTNQQEARLLKVPGYRQRIAESLLA